MRLFPLPRSAINDNEQEDTHSGNLRGSSGAPSIPFLSALHPIAPSRHTNSPSALRGRAKQTFEATAPSLARGVTTTTNMVPPFQPGIETSRFGICRPSRLLSEFLPPSPMSTGGVRTAPPVFHKPPPPAFPPSFSFKPLSSNR